MDIAVCSEEIHDVSSFTSELPCRRDVHDILPWFATMSRQGSKYFNFDLTEMRPALILVTYESQVKCVASFHQIQSSGELFIFRVWVLMCLFCD